MADHHVVVSLDVMPPSLTTAATSPSVFWPKGCTKDGLCYGWLSPAICVAGVLEDSVAEQNASALLTAALARSTLWKPLKKCCGGSPTIIGRCWFSGNREDWHSEKKRRAVVPTSFKLFHKEEGRYSFVLYRPHAPNSLRFYSLVSPQVTSSTPSSTTNNPFQMIAKYDFTRPHPIGIENALNATLLNQLNASFIIQNAVRSDASKPKLLPITATFLLTLASHLTLFSRILLWFSNLAASFVRIPIFPEPRLSLGTIRYLPLKDVSATVQQLDVRVEQAVFFLTQVSALQRQNTHDVGSYSVRYTNFFNTFWLIMNDMTLGFAFGAFLSENSIELSVTINAWIHTFLFHFPRTALYWLDAWPAGLKLNAELSRFCANTLIGLIDTWYSVLPPLSPSFFRTLGFFASIGGCTLFLSLLSDIISFFLSAHLRIGYELTRLVYWAAGVKLGGGLLWGLFRGKRRNVLRNRTDTWDYDIDQLLFGTVLFTLMVFLFPTALVYYVLFAGLRLSTLLVQAVIETLLAFMHHFPLFALMLRVKDPWRLPGGIFFALKVPEHGQTTYLSLEIQSISASFIFFEYNELWNRLARHYNPLRLLYRVLSGQHLASIPPYSIRYAYGPANLEEEDNE